MEFLKSILRSLPLETLSDILARVVFWWIRLTKGVSEDVLAQYTYVGSALLVLALLAIIAKCLPRFLRGFMWVVWAISAALLLTPAPVLGDTGGNAPAVIAALHALLMGEPKLALVAFLPVLGVITALLFIGAIWQFIKATLKKPAKASA